MALRDRYKGLVGESWHFYLVVETGPLVGLVEIAEVS